jgi:hypothetical protein
LDATLELFFPGALGEGAALSGFFDAFALLGAFAAFLTAFLAAMVYLTS